MADLSDEDKGALAILERALNAYRESAVLCDLAAIARLSEEQSGDPVALPHDLNYPLGVSLVRVG